MNQRRDISRERLDRLLRWSNLTLLRLAHWIVLHVGAWAPLERAIERILNLGLKRIEKIICALIVLKAGAHRLRAAPSRIPCLTPQSKTFRALFGARLRRLARGRDPRAKIAALLVLLRDADRESARFARRFKNGFTRRIGGFVPAQKPARLLRAAPVFALRGADTS